MYSGNLINELIATVERAEARFDTHDDRESELALWSALIGPEAPSYELMNPNLAGVA